MLSIESIRSPIYQTNIGSDHELALLNVDCRLFRAFVAAEDEDGALELLSQIQPFDFQDPHVQIILMQTLQPHCEAAQDFPEDAQAPETLPKVRQKLHELVESHPMRYRADD